MKPKTPNTAVLATGEAVRLDNTDRQPFARDAEWRERNRALLPDNPRAFAQAEIDRLREKGWQMQRLGIDCIEYRDAPPRGLSLGMRRLIQLSYNEARDSYSTSTQWETYLALWEWCSVRLSSCKQDAFWEKFGKVAYYQRINKVRRACGFSEIVAQ